MKQYKFRVVNMELRDVVVNANDEKEARRHLRNFSEVVSDDLVSQEYYSEDAELLDIVEE